MKNKNWFWGIFFILSAVAVIALQIGSFGEIGIWSLLVGVLLIALLIHSLFKLNYFGIFLPVAFLYMVFWQPLGFVHISPWMLILSGVFVSTGFSILFHRRHDYKHDWYNDKEFGAKNAEATETIDDNHPYAKVQFGSSSKYLHSNNLQSGKFIASFGELEVFFDQVQLNSEGAEIFLDCSFASIKLNIPRQWRVIDNLHVSLAEVNNNKRTAPAEDAPRITLSGNVQFGGVEIQYI